MSIAIDGGRTPKLLSRHKYLRPAKSAESQASHARTIQIALINNMPDAALEDTEAQFFDLLGAAAGEIPLSLKFYSLPELSRTNSGQRHVENFYFDISDLLNGHFDGIIITGTEPIESDLRDEPYWPALTEVLDWAERNTASTVLSCLAAHAGVLYSDSIPRHRLLDKQFGVFEYKTMQHHALTDGLGDGMKIPHSRWNEVRADALASCGYEVLTQSADAGVDLFVKNRRESLFVHFQGHPEYSTRTLLKEFRRDVKRFLKRERETFPSLPAGYFDATASELVSAFRETVITNPREELFEGFPEAALAETICAKWQASAVSVYRNWLHYLMSKNAKGPLPSNMSRVTRE